MPRDEDYKTSVTRAPDLPLLSMESTPAEETGPRFGHSLIGPLDNNLILNFTGEAAIGERYSASMAACSTKPGGPCPRRWSRSGRPNAGGRYRHVKGIRISPRSTRISAAAGGP